MHIFIDNMRVRARHGVLPQERLVGADFLVSLRVSCDFMQAAINDDLSDTISYADLADDIVREMALPSRLLENVAYRIAKAVLDNHPQAAEVWVRVTKQKPPISADLPAAGVEMTLRK